MQGLSVDDLFDDCVPSDDGEPWGLVTKKAHPPAATWGTVPFADKNNYDVTRDSMATGVGSSFGTAFGTSFGTSFGSGFGTSFGEVLSGDGSLDMTSVGSPTSDVDFASVSMTFQSSLARRAKQLSVAIGAQAANATDSDAPPGFMLKAIGQPTYATPSVRPPPGLEHLGPLMPQPVMDSSSVPPPPKPADGCCEGFSLGSLLHASGQCTPCKFYRGRRGCKDGQNCNLCHSPHEDLTYSGIRRIMRLKCLQKKQARESAVMAMNAANGF